MFRRAFLLALLLLGSGCRLTPDPGKTFETYFTTEAKAVSELKGGGTVWFSHDVWLTFTASAPMQLKDARNYRKIEPSQARDIVAEIPGSAAFFGPDEKPFCLLKTDTKTTDLNGTLVIWDKDRKRFLLRSWRHR